MDGESTTQLFAYRVVNDIVGLLGEVL